MAPAGPFQIPSDKVDRAKFSLKSAITTASARTGENPREGDQERTKGLMFNCWCGRRFGISARDHQPLARSPSSRNSFTFRRTNFTILFPPLLHLSFKQVRYHAPILSLLAPPWFVRQSAASTLSSLPPIHKTDSLSQSWPRQPDPKQHPPTNFLVR